ncbi:MAG: CocE/NonD family hydrolase [Chloroflexi bacterium]|nr:CocE/NonD family hydrolase [Chloroflexota bacterium]
MQIKTEFPHKIQEIENCWIPLVDGSRLAARIWLPVTATDHPVPAILEYLPYRKNDFTAQRDAIHHPYFAGHGYAAVRVDMRGCGDSDGILYDEYLLQEQDDGLEVLAWIANQPWCTGDVGMIGISWGGFNGLQIAARRPPELKAIITLCSTDDRFADDVHYMGGCILASDMLNWASIMLAYNARPPDPRFVGERWREMWLERMEETPPFVEAWLKHQRRNEYWQHGSVCENYDDISCPVYAVGGWADGYSNVVFRLLDGLSGPRKGLIGPWAHLYPETAVPHPQIGFLQECLRWWDKWLKGKETGIMDEPMLRVWMQDSVPPQTHYESRAGRWVAESSWPTPTISAQTYFLNDDMLDFEPSESREQTILGKQTTGLDAGVWWSSGLPGDMASDQQLEDSQSLCFTSAPLTKPVEILGFPEVRLTLAVDRPLALLAIRLCDVAPDGASTLISRGLLNLTHRESHENPTLLQMKRPYEITIRLNGIAHSLPVGHRWRIALSPTYWPHAWPSPESVTLTLFTGEASKLILPVRPPRTEDVDLTPFAAPEISAPLAVETRREASRERVIERDLIGDEVRLVDKVDNGRFHLINADIEYEAVAKNCFTIVENAPLSATVRCDRMIEIGRSAGQIRIETSSEMSSDATTFYVTNSLTAFEDESQVFAKTWRCEIPRDFQ